MDPMAAADGRRIFVLESTGLEGRLHLCDVADQEIGSPHQLNVQAGVENVGGCHALMDEACLRPDDLGEICQKSDNVVLDLTLDGIDPLGSNWTEPALSHKARAADRGTMPNSAMASVACASISNQMRAGLGRPDGRHFGPGVARDHGRSSNPRSPVTQEPALRNCNPPARIFR